MGRDGAGVELDEYDADNRALILSPDPISVVTILRSVLRAHIRWLGAMNQKGQLVMMINKKINLRENSISPFSFVY